MFHNYSAAHSAVRHWAKQFDKLQQRLAIVQKRLDASSSMVIVNWTLCITFGIFKLFSQWAVYFITLHWFGTLTNCLEWMPNCFEDNVILYAQCWRYAQWRTETQFRRLVTHNCQSLCTNSGRCAEFCSCVQTVLTIGHLQLQKGVIIGTVPSPTWYPVPWWLRESRDHPPHSRRLWPSSRPPNKRWLVAGTSWTDSAGPCCDPPPLYDRGLFGCRKTFCRSVTSPSYDVSPAQSSRMFRWTPTQRILRSNS